jgi:phytoene dehydrogenase-like protein
MVPKIAVIGAGIAGIHCCSELIKQGYQVDLYEKSGKVGGRMKTDLIRGFQIDHGFHVLQTGYEFTQSVINYDKLEAKAFEPGALVIRSSTRRNKVWRLSDPFRRPFSSIKDAFGFFASPFDMLKVLLMRRKIARIPLSEIFDKGELSTEQWLSKQGFSQGFINRFFYPLFSGIFLESELRTNERLFKFVFRTMSKGDMVLPKNGIESIPLLLSKSIPKPNIKLNSEVELVSQNLIKVNGADIEYDGVVIAYDNRPSQSKKHVWTLYFSADKSPFPSKHIMLNSELRDFDNLISYVSVPSDIQPSYSPDGKSLICITVLGEKCEQLGLHLEDEILAKVKSELLKWYGEDTKSWESIATQHIIKALPETDSSIFTKSISKVDDGFFRCGDYMMHGSVEGTLISARNTVEEILRSIPLSQ